MNAAGHIAVVARARRQGNAGAGHQRDRGDASARLLGAALPDLAAMGRFRLRGARQAGSAITDGIALHHRTDDLFHRHPWFVELQRDLGTRLTANGLSRGPARACSHVGIELLLDGRLLASAEVDRETRAALRQIDGHRDEIVALVVAERRDTWDRHLGRLATNRLPTWYHRPDAVAEVLHRMLSHRPRLAFGQESIATVASVLAEVKPVIDGRATGLVDELAAALYD